MKISAFTFIKNGEILGYPFLESIKSVLPLVDEFVINVGESEDNTLTLIEGLQEPKIRIIESKWNDKMRDRGFVYGQQKMIAQFNCTGDWAFYLEGDEIVHEQDLEIIKKACQLHLDNPKVEAIVSDYYHFYGNTNTYLWSPGWYRTAPRIIKNSIRSYAPDGLFWLVLDKNKIGRYPNAVLCNAHIYHYGWVRSEEQMNLKSQKVQQYWNKKHEAIDYRAIDHQILKEFKGTHPAIMKEWLSKEASLFEANPDYILSKKEKKHRLMLKLESLFGVELSKKHYRLVK